MLLCCGVLALNLSVALAQDMPDTPPPPPAREDVFGGNTDTSPTDAPANPLAVFATPTPVMPFVLPAAPVNAASGQTPQACNPRTTRDNVGAYQRNGVWRLENRGGTPITFAFGSGQGTALAGRWSPFTPTNADSVGIHTGNTFTLRSNLYNTGTVSFAFGLETDRPVIGDWDGNGLHEVGVYRQSNGLAYLRSDTGQTATVNAFTFGSPGDYVVAGDWDGNTADSLGLFRPGNNTWYLRNSNSTGFADEAFVYAPPGPVTDWTPVAGYMGQCRDTVGFHNQTFGIWRLRRADGSTLQLETGVGGPGVIGRWGALRNP